MTKTKAKAPAMDLPVPQSREDAAQQLARIGELARAAGGIEREMNDALAKIKADAEAKSTPLANEGARLLAGLEVWCASHRDQLTEGGKVKSADLGTGVVGWRLRNAKVNLRDAAKVLDAIKERRLSQFIRTTEEVNKQAMLDNPALANTIPGVKVASAGENFFAEPFQAELSEAVS